MFERDESMRHFGATTIDNVFIQDYLPAARGDYVKVYLYALFLSAHAGEETSMASLAHDLGMGENEVESALRYWERRRLVTRVSDQPPVYRFRSALQLLLTGEADMEADMAYVSFSEDVYALFGERRKVRPADIALAWEWVQDLHLRQETVLMLLSHCIATRGVQFSFQAAQTEAVRMCENNVVTLEDAEDYFANSRRVEEGARAVLRRLGKRRGASQDEMELYRKWTQEWQYTGEAILEACRETTKGEPTFAYLDGILQGIRTRASKGSDTPKTGDALRSQLAQEKDAHAALRAFAQALGYKGAPALIAPVYQRLTASYPADFVLLVAQETRAAGGDLDAVVKTCEGLSRRGIAAAQTARVYFEEMHAVNRALQPLFEALGLSGRPTASDRTLYKKWQSYGMSEEMLLLAAEQSRGADKKLPYMDRILQAWHEEGITSPAQVAARKEQRAPAQGTARRVAAQQYTQREYSDEELNAFTADLIKEARNLNEQ